MWKDLSEEQWRIVSAILPPDPARPDRRGRPWSDRRKALNGALWILSTGASWRSLPPRFGNYKTVHRRFRQWARTGVMDQVLLTVARDLKDRGGLDLRKCLVAGPGVVISPKRGGGARAEPSVKDTRKAWVLPTAMVFRSAYARQVLARWK